jgi:hypothetical protein
MSAYLVMHWRNSAHGAASLFVFIKIEIICIINMKKFNFSG